MRKLQITQCFDNIQTFYDKPSITWTRECAEFVINENEPTTAHLMVWLDGVTPEQIVIELDGLERKIDEFLLAMQVMNNARMRKKGEPELKYTAKGGQEFLIEKHSLANIVDDILRYERGEIWGLSGTFSKSTISSSAISPTVPFPQTLPKIPLELERLISIFSSAENFSGDYREEHQLRNYFLIMEELCDENGKIKKPSSYDDLNKVRNFISHAMCDYYPMVQFFLNNFPEALQVIFDKKGKPKPYAQFDRTKNSHINFIWKYRDEAYQWVKKELAKELL